ncbi:MAG: hypothetical protein ACKOAZ_06680 [Ilumatobacteraceae bacterium]
MRTLSRLAVAAVVATGTIVVPSSFGGPLAGAVDPACNGSGGRPEVMALQSENFYIDADRDQLLAQYAGYSIDASGTESIGYWIELSSFTGGVVSLNDGEPGAQSIRSLAGGDTATHYFLLEATGETLVDQSHTVRIYDAPPAYGSVVCALTFTYTQVVDTIAARANKVTSVSTDSSAEATIGDEVTVTVTGQTGTLGAGPSYDLGALNYTPTALASFPAESWRLVSTELDISPDGSSAVETFTDQLRLADSASGPNRNYTARYTFRAVGPAASTALVVPIQYIASGTQIKHTTLTAPYPSLPTVAGNFDVTLDKKAEPDFIPDETDAIVDYTVTVTNDTASDVTLDDVTDTLPDGSSYVTDTLVVDGEAVDPVSTSPLVAAGPIVVPAGGSIDITYTVDLGTVITGARTNSAVGHIGEVQVDASSDVRESSPASATVIVQEPIPAVAVTKTAGAVDDVAVGGVDGRADAGDTITYTYEVDNTGRTDLFDISVVDDRIDDDAANIICPGATEPANVISTILRGGASVTCEATYTITQDDLDAGEVTNTVLVTGYDPESDEVTDEQSVTKELPAVPVLTVDKSGTLDLTVVDPDARIDAGDTATYTFVVTNDGNVTLEGVSLSDNRIDDADVSCGTTEVDLVDDNSIGDLAVGESRTCTADYTVTQDDIDAGNISNIATATGTDVTPDANEAEGTGTESLDLVADPELTVEKSADRESVNLIGEVIGYTIVVTNTGNVTLSEVTVADDLLADLACTPGEGVSGPVLEEGADPVIENGTYIVSPGESVECTGTYTTTEDDFALASIPNTATATGLAPAGTVPGEWEGSTEVIIDPLTADITGRVFVDRNGNRRWDTGDIPLIGNELQIDLEVPRVAPAEISVAALPTYSELITTVANGAYRVSDIPAGEYRLVAAPAPGVRRVTDFDGGIDWEAVADVPSITPALNGGTTTVNFVGAGLGTIVGRVYQPTGDLGIPFSSVRCTWFGLDGLEGTDDDWTISTNAVVDGAYRFESVPYGSYLCTGLTPDGGVSLPSRPVVDSPAESWAPLPLPTIPETGGSVGETLRIVALLLGLGAVLTLVSSRRIRRAVR